MLCVFSSISSPGMMDLLKEVSVAFRQSDHSSASAPRRCNRCVGKLPPLGQKHLRRGVVGKDGWRCRAGEFLFAGDGSRCLPGDCSLLDTLLGPGTTLVEFPKFVFLRCLVSLPFRADVVDILIVGSQVDLPSNRRCDLRQETLHSVRWKPCGGEVVSGIRRCHGLWGVADSGLNAQGERFLRVNSCGSKRRFEGIWNDVSCIFDCTFALISISENCISIVEHADCSIVAPWI